MCSLHKREVPACFLISAALPELRPHFLLQSGATSSAPQHLRPHVGGGGLQGRRTNRARLDWGKLRPDEELTAPPPGSLLGLIKPRREGSPRPKAHLEKVTEKKENSWHRSDLILTGR